MRLLVLFVLGLLPSLAFAQGGVLQYGPVNIGHPAMWYGNGAIGDGGSPQGGAVGALGLTGVGVTNSTTQGICTNSGPITSSYAQLCLGFNNGVPQITLGGTPSPTTLQFSVNGVLYNIPGANCSGCGSLASQNANSVAISGGNISGVALSGVTDTGGTFTSPTISGATISSGTIATAGITGGTISGATISGGTISGAAISGGSLSGITLASPTITGSVSGSPEISGYEAAVATNAALVALPNGFVPFVRRQGFYAAGDGGDATYNWSSSNCTLNSGAGDNGTQVEPATGSGCWLVVPQNFTFTPEMFGAHGDGAAGAPHNDTTAIQAAITAAELFPNGVGKVVFGAKTYLFTPSLAVTSTVTLLGQGPNSTILQAVSGSSANFINVGFQTSEIDGVQIQGFYLKITSPLGGYGIASQNTGRMHVRDIHFGGGNPDSPYCGISDTQSNNNAYDDIWGYTQGTGCQSFLWYGGNQSLNQHSDQLELKNIEFDNEYYGNDGLVLRGNVHTLNTHTIVFLKSKHGFWVDASQTTTSGNGAGFASIYDLQVEGASVAACEIDEAQQFLFTDGFCGSFYGQTGSGGVQGDNDTAALVINSGASIGETNDIQFENMVIGGSANYAALITGKNLLFSNVSWRGSSLAVAYSKPSVQLVYDSTSGYSDAPYKFVNNKFCGLFGDTVQNNLGLIRPGGVGRVSIVGSDFQYCQAGEVQDNGSGGFTTASNTDVNGMPLPPSGYAYVSNKQPTAQNCGTSPTINGNNLIGSVTTGTGTFTQCTINFASVNAAGNGGLGQLGQLILQNITTGVVYVAPVVNPGYFTFQRLDAANLASQTIQWRVSQGVN